MNGKKPKKGDGRVHIDPIERGRPREDKEQPGGRKRKRPWPGPGEGIGKPIRPKPPITIQPVPKRPSRNNGRNR